jgi:hypothetical protein
MRNFQTLNQAAPDSATGLITFASDDGSALHPTLSMRREGEYVVISASSGALEIALRPRARELIRTLKHIQPNDGLNSTRQVGSGQAFLALGLRTDGALVVRPTIVGDGTGYFCLNLILAPSAAAALQSWLGDEPKP